jgi:hypothetical protein
MARLEDLTRGAAVKGVLPDGLVSVVDVKWIGTVAVELTYKDAAGRLGSELIYRDREPTLEVAAKGTAENALKEAGLIASRGGKVRLLKRPAQ